MAKQNLPTQTYAMLHKLRRQLSRAEKAQRKATQMSQATATEGTSKTSTSSRMSSSRTSSANMRPVSPQRESELEHVSTDEYTLTSAHAKLREIVYNAQYYVCAHAIQHARAEGFLEHDIIQVLLSGRVRAVYPEERRWLVCGFFESQGIFLPLHVVTEHQRSDFLDVVTAFVPKHPHHIMSRARLAVLLRYDDETIQVRTAPAKNKVGYKGKGRWKRLR